MELLQGVPSQMGRTSRGASRIAHAVVIAGLGVLLGVACDGMGGNNNDVNIPLVNPGNPDGANLGNNNNNPVGCDNLGPGDFMCTLQNRMYMLHVPASVSSPAPLVFDSHGLGGTAAGQRRLSGFLELSDRVGFVVIHAQGLNNSWNGTGNCCQFPPMTDDVAFFRAMVTRTKAAGNIDAQRVISTGFSNGGAISHRLACEAADVFAAIAPVAFSLGITSQPATSPQVVANACTPSQPITMFQTHGTADTVADFTNGVLNSLGAQDSFEAWTLVDRCNTNPGRVFGLPPNTICETRTAGCAGGAQVSLCAVNMAPHNAYPTFRQTGMTIPEAVYPRVLQAIQSQLDAGNRR